MQLKSNYDRDVRIQYGKLQRNMVNGYRGYHLIRRFHDFFSNEGRAQ